MATPRRGGLNGDPIRVIFPTPGRWFPSTGQSELKEALSFKIPPCGINRTPSQIEGGIE